MLASSFTLGMVAISAAGMWSQAYGTLMAYNAVLWAFITFVLMACGS